MFSHVVVLQYNEIRYRTNYTGQSHFPIKGPRLNFKISKTDLGQSYHSFDFGRSDQIMPVNLGNGKVFLMHIKSKSNCHYGVDIQTFGKQLAPSIACAALGHAVNDLLRDSVTLMKVLTF